MLPCASVSLYQAPNGDKDKILTRQHCMDANSLGKQRSGEGKRRLNPNRLIP